MGGKPYNPYEDMANAIRDASNIQAQSAQKAMDIAQNQFDASLNFMSKQYSQSRADVAPYRDIGLSATNEMYDIMGLEPPNTDPAVDFWQKYQSLQDEIGSTKSLNKIKNSSFDKGDDWMDFSKADTEDTDYYLQNRQKDFDYLKNIAYGIPQRSPFEASMQGLTNYFPNNQRLKAIYESMARDRANMEAEKYKNMSPDWNAIKNDPRSYGMWKNLGLMDLDRWGQPAEDRQARAMKAITENPDYQFRLTQGLDSIQNSAAAQGSLDSGAALKAITEYGQGMAANSYGDRIRYLSGLMDSGQNAATFSAQQGQQQGQDVANMRQQLGDTLGSGAMAQGNILANGLIGSKRWDIHAKAFDQQNKNSAINMGFGILGKVMGMAGGMGGGGGMGM